MTFGSGTQLGTQVGSLSDSTTGVGIGAGVGAAFDIFSILGQTSQAKKNFENFTLFQQESARLQERQSAARVLQENLNAAQAQEDLRIAAQLSLSAANQSAGESGVSGNSIRSLDSARRLQVSRVKSRIQERLRQVSGDAQVQNQAIRLQTHANIVNAALELERDAPSIFEIVGGAVGAGLVLDDAIHSVGSVGPQEGPVQSSPLAGPSTPVTTGTGEPSSNIGVLGPAGQALQASSGALPS